MSEIKKEIKCENGVISVLPPLNNPNIKGLGSTLFQKILERQDGVAEIYGVTGETAKWNYILKTSIQLAIAMRSRGITQNDFTSVCSLNYPEYCIAILGTLFVGAKVTNLDPTGSLSDAVHILKQIRPKIIFIDPDILRFVENAIREAKTDTRIVVYGPTLKHWPLHGLAIPSPEEKTFVPVDVQDVNETAIVVFKNGTSGLPEGICLSHYALLASKFDEQIKASAGKVYLSFNSFYCISAVSAMLYGALGGLIRVVYPIFDVEYIWRMIVDQQVNVLFLAPSQIITVCKNGRPEDIDTPDLSTVIIDGSVSKEQMLEIRRVFKGVRVLSRYGLAELADNGLGWTLEAEDLRLLQGRPDANGRPMQGAQYKIVDPETEEILGPNQKGELRIKSEFGMNGYYNLDSTDAWDSDGFLKTGDSAYYDADYCFYIMGPIKDMLKFQMQEIVPAKLEAVLLSHTSVEAAVVLGLPHPKDGDHPMALVVLTKTCVDITAEELEKYVEERVDDQERLRGGVRIVKSIPVNADGKYDRRRIQDMVLQKEL